jgi:hypothetical protein
VDALTTALVECHPDLGTQERDADIIIQIMDTSCRTIITKRPAASRENFF